MQFDRLKRRQFMGLLAGAAAWPLAARAQQGAVPVVGFLSGRSSASDAHLVTAFRRGLNETGYIEGQNVTIEFRWANGQVDLLPKLAVELVARAQMALIFAGAVDDQMYGVKAAVSTLPVVIATGGDPVERGLAVSFNRPGGNITGVTVFSAALLPKRLQLLRESMSSTGLIAVLVNPNNPITATIMNEVEAAARDMGLSTVILKASNERELDAAFETFVGQRARALVVADDAVFITGREKLVSLVARESVPAIYGRREFTYSGGLMSYGASITDQYYQSGLYAGRILKGAKPADLPFLQPTKFEFVINLRTANSLGFGFPPGLLAIADDVIE
jgi:putative tryptophan/tyrosine transport system substrate-binding protein